MPTQYDNDVPFSAAHSQQAFKLLELPPELLALLESVNPPTLTITSSIPGPSSSSSTSTPLYAILNCDSKQYQMRQKNTSNPIMVLQPSTTSPEDVNDAHTFIHRPSVTAISKVEDTIELKLLEDTDREGKGESRVKKVNKWHEKFAKGRGTAKKDE